MRVNWWKKESSLFHKKVMRKRKHVSSQKSRSKGSRNESELLRDKLDFK